MSSPSFGLSSSPSKLGLVMENYQTLSNNGYVSTGSTESSTDSRQSHARVERERCLYADQIMSLGTIKEHFARMIGERFKTINANYFLNQEFTSNKHELYSYYLHFMIIFGSPVIIHNFLEKFCNDYGEMATRMFVNYNLVDIHTKNIISPLICCLMWSNHSDKLRVLYAWGADVTSTDIHGNYVEDMYKSYYINHLYICGLAPKYINLGRRCKKDFASIINELGCLAKEIYPPNGWEYPACAYQQRNAAANRTAPTIPMAIPE
jgi:hypothetical protein